MEKTGRSRKFHYPNTLHHVMMRGNNRKKIFYDVEDYERFLSILSESTENFDHEIICYCLMPNHVHLLLKVNTIPLSKIMQNIAFRHAKWVNHKRNRVRHLFQGRYKSILVAENHYLVNVARYIHLNPVAAKMVIEPSLYLWSSHRYYISDSLHWLNTSIVRAAVEEVVGQSYENFMNTQIDRDEWKPRLYIADTGHLILDDDAKKLSYKAGDVVNYAPLEMQLVLNRTKLIMNIDLNVLNSKGRSRREASE